MFYDDCSSHFDKELRMETSEKPKGKSRGPAMMTGKKMLTIDEQRFDDFVEVVKRSRNSKRVRKASKIIRSLLQPRK
jgi:DNA relaxase NicK